MTLFIQILNILILLAIIAMPVLLLSFMRKNQVLEKRLTTLESEVEFLKQVQDKQ